MATEAKRTEAKIQHYVPQYYLRSFIDAKEQLYVVDRPRGKFFRVPTKKVGGELYFNLINVKGIDPFAIEKALAELEGHSCSRSQTYQGSKIARGRERPKRGHKSHCLGYDT